MSENPAPQEWTDPRYADIVAAMRRAQTASPSRSGPRPLRGFVTGQPKG